MRQLSHQGVGLALVLLHHLLGVLVGGLETLLALLVVAGPAESRNIVEAVFLRPVLLGRVELCRATSAARPLCAASALPMAFSILPPISPRTLAALFHCSAPVLDGGGGSSVASTLPAMAWRYILAPLA
ncbi:hypothetical protein [Haloactinomyces albus]|uniref:Uncharacterized protein n=1 Tax=Haloactinomyces albus TaxID=1352928 RepID=A0AAE4CLW9_9ACTN|nr:hypothetical protein [Haloactinomyces albus]MDR7301781.1 hypothetical protein [Haloactinomyces albus]